MGWDVSSTSLRTRTMHAHLRFACCRHILVLECSSLRRIIYASMRRRANVACFLLCIRYDVLCSSKLIWYLLLAYSVFTFTRSCIHLRVVRPILASYIAVIAYFEYALSLSLYIRVGIPDLSSVYLFTYQDAA